jgi:hypothetical protein
MRYTISYEMYENRTWLAKRLDGFLAVTPSFNTQKWLFCPQKVSIKLNMMRVESVEVAEFIRSVAFGESVAKVISPTCYSQNDMWSILDGKTIKAPGNGQSVLILWVAAQTLIRDQFQIPIHHLLI